MKYTILIFACLICSSGMLAKPLEKRVNASSYLESVLEKLNNIKYAEYNSISYACSFGDTVISENKKQYSFVKEYAVEQDIYVGAKYIKYNIKDTSKVLYAYDGIFDLLIHERNNYYVLNDFTANSNEYRKVNAPFYAKSKALIEFSLLSNDSIQITSTAKDNAVEVKIKMLNKHCDFRGKQLTALKDSGKLSEIVSEYILLIDKKSNLPIRFQSNLANINKTVVETINNSRFKEIEMEDFSVLDYIPKNLTRLGSNGILSYAGLKDSKAYNWKLPDLKENIYELNQFNSDVTIISFSSTYCGSCNNAIPFLNSLNKDINFCNINQVSIFNNKECKKLTEYINHNNADYPVLVSSDDVFSDYKVFLLPTFFVLDKDKRIIKVFQGFKEGKTDVEIKNLINALIKDPNLRVYNN